MDIKPLFAGLSPFRKVFLIWLAIMVTFVGTMTVSFSICPDCFPKWECPCLQSAGGCPGGG
jgi:hypothetical protein